MLRSILALMLFGFTAPIFAESAQTNTKPWTNKDYAALFSEIRYAGSYVTIMKALNGQSFDISYLAKTYGIQEESLLPKVRLDGNFVRVEGIKKKLDLTNLHKGEVYDGNSYFRFKPSESPERNLERLVNYLKEDPNKTAHWLRLIPQAYADVEEKAQAAGLFGVAAVSLAALPTAVTGAVAAGSATATALGPAPS